MEPTPPDSVSDEYAKRLEALQGKWWKRLLPVQAPYAWDLRRHDLGLVLDLGCGVGKDLRNLAGRGVGVDKNPAAVRICREQGLEAYTTDQFAESERASVGGFDSLLIGHVLEHLTRAEAMALVQQYLPFIRGRGQVVIRCPQERGYASDPTHVTFLDHDALGELVRACGLDIESSYSFPFPRWAGRAFVYNEFVVVARLPATAT